MIWESCGKKLLPGTSAERALAEVRRHHNHEPLCLRLRSALMYTPLPPQAEPKAFR
ncbi:hypothetical protein [Nocardia sp. NPDC052566]|uniref:hypothetical protein n=1 Tax=Nocardia sp. NPDC052566 TaxID=3364330 RepID=UPI0037C67D1C